jgi:hypothetical protein
MGTLMPVVAWFVAAGFLWMVGAVVVGRRFSDSSIPPNDRLIFAFLWPLIAAIAIIASPFLLSGWLILRPSKAERLKAEQDAREAEIAKMEKELGFKG